MARFIVLKGQNNYAVFDFDGNIARVGSGANVDLRLESDAGTDDFFFLTKTGAGGFQIEPRSSAVNIAVNGSPCSSPTLLDEGSKVSVLDYMILVSYQGQQAPKAKPTAEPTPPPKPEMPSAPKPPAVDADMGTAPAIGAPPPPRPSQPPATPPPSPPGAGDDATVRINFDERQQSVIPVKKKPVVEEVHGKIEPIFSLVCLSGQHKGKVFRIDSEEFIIGRDRGSSIVIDHDEKGRPDTSVSRKHLVFTSTDDGLYVVDKMSKLRTYINGRLIEADQREQVAPEDLISIPSPQGEIVFRLCFVDEENFAPVNASHTTMWLIIGLVAVIIILAAAWIVFLK